MQRKKEIHLMTSRSNPQTFCYRVAIRDGAFKNPHITTTHEIKDVTCELCKANYERRVKRNLGA